MIWVCRLLLASLVLTLVSQPAEAGGGWSFGLSFHAPFGRPCYGPYGGYYYRPYPVMVAPPPIYVAPVMAPVRVYQPVYPTPVEPTLPPPTPESPPTNVAPASALASAPRSPVIASSTDANHYLRLVNHPDSKTRADALVQLGVLRSTQSVDTLARALREDRDPAVREAAARGLGLIGAPNCLNALQTAAQADEDREVRHSARFAAESIRAALAGR